jgi:hypothetical protein
MFFDFAKQTAKQPKQREFQFVSVQPKKKFDCFEDTLHRSNLPHCHCVEQILSGKKGRVVSEGWRPAGDENAFSSFHTSINSNEGGTGVALYWVQAAFRTIHNKGAKNDSGLQTGII